MLTIFTPTYNRKTFLIEAYGALCRQTNMNFLWLIIDDGSTDGTDVLIDSWIREELIKIEYHYQKNSGKMRAHNYAVRLTKTELFTCIDSDDYIVPDTVQTILDLWSKLKSEPFFNHLSGIAAYRGDTPSHIMQGYPFPQVQLSTLGNLYKNGFKGETTLIFRTDLLRHYPFPEIDGERFIPEDVVYDKIDMKYQFYVLPKILTICHYQTGGLTDSINRLRTENPYGYLLYYQIKINITPPSVLRYKYIAHAIRFAWYTKNNIFKIIPALNIEILICIPAALLLKIRNKL